MEDLENYDFYVDYDTIKWWFSQSKKAIESVFLNGGYPLDHVLKEFAKWIGKKQYNFYAHATFDFPVIEQNYRKLKIKNPIPFRNTRDLRTLTDIAGSFEVKANKLKHNALADARYQTEYCIAQLKYLNQKLT